MSPNGMSRVAGRVLELGLLLVACAGLSAADPRVMLLEESAREIGRIAGAVRIAVPEQGGHVAVLTAAGEVWTWGDNASGQLGTGDRGPVEGWHHVEGLTSVVAIAAGAQHTVALRTDGTVWVWGEAGQPGVEPREVMGLREVVSVAAGEGFTAALKADGTLWMWRAGEEPEQVAGVEMWGEIEVVEGRIVEQATRTREDLVQRIAAVTRRGDAPPLLDLAQGWTLAWIEDSGTAAGAVGEPGGAPETPQPRQSQEVPETGGLAGEKTLLEVVGAVKVAAGGDHSLAIASDGTVWAWGFNFQG